MTLSINVGFAFQGPVKVGPFDIDQNTAEIMLVQANPHSLPNRNVIFPWVGAIDITKYRRNKYIIYFGDLSIEEASLYEAPFEYVRKYVKPMRDQNNEPNRRRYWWRLGRSGAA